MSMPIILPIAEVRSRFSELVSLVESSGRRVAVTRNGRGAVALVSLGELEALEDRIESLEETLAVLREPGILAELAEEEAEFEAGGGVTGEELDAMLAERARREQPGSQDVA
ncbi:type II toxin-antitoxin system Phd/YefM family antitoxin [Embleya sp. NPDC059237]|uniref:type II toxin-antitoxin system Phd/YefM family antitoxin n=1 Tax=Embleya sp. NPDC059237 TaxID=3346784 RepID=UPI00368DDEE1